MATVTEQEPNNYSSSANSLTLGNTVSGSLSSSSDWDYYKVTVAASTVLKLDFVPPTHSSSTYFYVAVYDATNKLLAADFAGDAATLSLGLPAAGSYYIAVTSSTSFSGGQYALTASAGSPALYESEANETLATADSVVPGQTIIGQLASSADLDCYRITATSAGVLVVDFAASKTSSRDSFTLDVYDAAGKLVSEQSTAHATTLSVGVPALGDYYVKVKQASSYDGGNYSLTANNSSIAALGAKSFDGSKPVTATLSAAHDWYALNLVAGTTYEFAVAAVASGGGTLADPYLTLCYSNGTPLEACDDLSVWSTSSNGATSSKDPQIAFTAPATGSYYLMVAGNGGTGSYTLSQTTDPPADLVQDLLNLQISPAFRWNGSTALGTPVSLSYSFLTSSADGESGFVAMNASQKQIVRDVLAMYASVANISFTETTNQATADIRFGTSDQSGVSSGITWTSVNGDGSLSLADVFINNTGSSPATSTMTPGGYGYTTVIHETGHALGLKHPGYYNSTGGGASPPFLPLALDSEKFTVMSYLDNPDSSVYYSTPALLDIAAVQHLYGAKTSAAGAVHSFTFSSSAPFATALLSSGSDDSLDISNQTQPARIFMTPGSLSSIGVDASGAPARHNVAIPYGEKLVNVTGGQGNDLIVGNALDNKFFGFVGNDSIDGGGGSDTLVLSATSASFNSAADAQLLNVRSIDASVAAAGVSLDAHRQSETLTLIGSAYADTIVASAGGGSISGGAGNDSITGGAGSDIAVYVSNRANYTTTFTSAGRYTITDKQGSAGSDTLINLDDIRYADGMQNLNIAADVGSISAAQLSGLTELYIAYFNRVPEAAGLDYWIKQYAAGASLDQIGGAFYAAAISPDYAALTGYSATMSDADFVAKIYLNVLGRSSPDQAGLNYWLAGLADHSQTRGSLINTILVAAHGYKGDPTYGPVADLLDNKVSVGKYSAVTAAVDYLTPQEAISKGMALASAITATDTSHAIQLIGLADVVPYIP